MDFLSAVPVVAFRIPILLTLILIRCVLYILQTKLITLGKGFKKAHDLLLKNMTINQFVFVTSPCTASELDIIHCACPEESRPGTDLGYITMGSKGIFSILGL